VAFYSGTFSVDAPSSRKKTFQFDGVLPSLYLNGEDSLACAGPLINGTRREDTYKANVQFASTEFWNSNLNPCYPLLPVRILPPYKLNKAYNKILKGQQLLFYYGDDFSTAGFVSWD